MTFDAFETADGSPVEVLTFQNGTQTFRYTNAVRTVQVGAFDFVPLAYTRTKFAQSRDSDDQNLTINVPRQLPVVGLYNGVLTSDVTTLAVDRYHLDDTPIPEVQNSFRGRVVAINHKNETVDLLLQPITYGGEATPRDVFSGLCNSMLFDTPGCSLIRDDWRYIGTINGIDVAGTTITINGLRVQAAALDAAQGGPTGPLTSGELDLYWQGGFIITGNGETRDIIQGNAGGDPDAVRLDQPFRDVIVGDGCNVFAGCLLDRGICHKKFNNVINFQGFPDIPEIDPANTELPPGASSDDFKFTGG